MYLYQFVHTTKVPLTPNAAAFTYVQHSFLSDHNTKAPCCFIRYLNKEFIIAARLALYERSGTRCVLDKQMNHWQLDLGAATTKSTASPQKCFSSCVVKVHLSVQKQPPFLSWQETTHFC